MSRIHTEIRTRTTTPSPRQYRSLTRPQAAHPAAIIQRVGAASELLSAADVMQLTIGNRAVGRDRWCISSAAINLITKPIDM